MNGMNAEKLIDLYCLAWSEPSPTDRLHLLSPIWAEGATYSDPTVTVTGLNALLEHISQVHAQRPGMRVMRTSRVDLHHGMGRFGWKAVTANGQALPDSLDIVFLSEDGSQIKQIIGFFGPLRQS